MIVVEYLKIGQKNKLASLLLNTIPCKVYALVNHLVTVKSGKAMFEVIITSDVPCLFWSHEMIIEKVMNNNCVQASMNGQEVIISGPGVGYNKNMACLYLSIRLTEFFMSGMSKK